jgi:hypothetical protein
LGITQKDFFFIKPGKVFLALQGYFLTMLGKGISSQRRGPGNLAEDSGLGNSNRPASPHPPGKKKKKASVAILRWSCYEEDMYCSSNKVICMMSKLANYVSHCDSKEEHLQRKLRHLVTFQLQ